MNSSSCPGDSHNRTVDTGASQQSRLRRRLFSVGNFRFRFSRARLVDAIVDGASCVVETFVYLIGPLLILLALWIIGLLTYVFATILLPMLESKYRGSPLKYLYLTLHCCWVAFVVVNVLFNYALCVKTRHTGPHYDKVVRELAVATDMVYPETPAQLAQYRHDFEDKMYLRMRRRRARAAQRVEGPAAANGMTHRKLPPTNSSSPQPASPGQHPSSPTRIPPPSQTSPQQQLRGWMLLGPLEWGYCSISNQPKPPRSHYDHVTKQLVLNLDHYCPWMFNSIGYFNYRYFVTFLVYIFVGMLYGSLLAYQPFMLLQSPEYKRQIQHERLLGHRPNERLIPMLPFRDERMLLTLAFMLCTAVGAAVLLLGGFHIYLVLTGQTTIEFHANWMHRKRARASNMKWTNPYSLGSSRQNFEQVFGKRRGFWGCLSYVLPSTREREYLPVAIPGHPGRVGMQQWGQKNSDANSVLMV